MTFFFFLKKDKCGSWLIFVNKFVHWFEQYTDITSATNAHRKFYFDERLRRVPKSGRYQFLTGEVTIMPLATSFPTHHYSEGRHCDVTGWQWRWPLTYFCYPGGGSREAEKALVLRKLYLGPMSG